jgi:hypothetical protein
MRIEIPVVIGEISTSRKKKLEQALDGTSDHFARLSKINAPYFNCLDKENNVSLMIMPNKVVLEANTNPALKPVEVKCCIEKFYEYLTVIYDLFLIDKKGTPLLLMVSHYKDKENAMKKTLAIFDSKNINNSWNTMEGIGLKFFDNSKFGKMTFRVEPRTNTEHSEEFYIEGCVNLKEADFAKLQNECNEVYEYFNGNFCNEVLKKIIN